MKKFFGINTRYRFELGDLTTVITVANVAFVIMGYKWAPLLGIGNALIFLVYNKKCAHVNVYITQFALIMLNIFFLLNNA